VADSNAVSRAPIGEQQRQKAADQRREPVCPDFLVLGTAEDFRRGCLQPIDADRLVVARPFAEADVNEITRLYHLLGGLGKTAFVAIEGRQREKARHPGDHAKQEQCRCRPAGEPPEHAGRKRCCFGHLWNAS
jgi:hypothetical protein